MHAHTSTRQLQFAVYSSLMAALTAFGAYIHIPLGPVPIVLQNLFVLLAGLLLGGRWGLISMVIYLFVGAMGMPLFAGGKGGIAHLVGPTGGYLFGFAAAAFAVGTLSERQGGRKSGDIIAVLAGTIMIYAFGVPWLKAATGLDWQKAILLGMLPFLPGDLIKASAAVFIARSIRPVLNRYLQPIST